VEEDGRTIGGDDEVLRQIRITILHEIGHHFGLSEEDLAALGYE
jgi:predicted Zn-dependent protease with MMP-like domain